MLLTAERPPCWVQNDWQMRIKNFAHWDNWQGWHTPAVYRRAEDTEVISYPVALQYMTVAILGCQSMEHAVANPLNVQLNRKSTKLKDFIGKVKMDWFYVLRIWYMVLRRYCKFCGF